MPQTPDAKSIPAEYDPVFDVIRASLQAEWVLLAPEVITEMATTIMVDLFDEGLLATPVRCTFGAGSEASWCGEDAPLGQTVCTKHLDWWKR